MDVLLDGVNELRVLLGGVGVVEPQIADAAELLGGAKVNGQGLAVADVQVAVGLRRETGVDGHALELSAGGDVLFNESVDEIPALRRLLPRGFDLLCHALSVLPVQVFQHRTVLYRIP